jgi:hypothetical protein
MSRNENRTETIDPEFLAEGSPQPAGNTPPGLSPNNPTEPRFNWAVPTEFVELPSQGKFYPENHPLHNQTTIEIRYMTAKEEDILTSRALLKQGVALDRMLQNIIVNSQIRVDTLLVGDKNALLVGARRTGYGADYTTNITCPSCANSDEFTFDLEDPPMNNAAEVLATADDVVQMDNGNFKFTLPMTKVEVECRLLTSADEARFTKNIDKKTRSNQNSGTMTELFRNYIVSVNGDTSPIMKETLIQNMPARDARYLRTRYVEIVPNIDLTQNYSCTNCGYEADMEVPLGVDFFWPG